MIGAVIIVMSSTLLPLKARFLLVDRNMITYIHPLQQSRSGLFTKIMSSSGPCITVIMIMSSSWSRQQNCHGCAQASAKAEQAMSSPETALPFPSSMISISIPDQSQSGYFTGLDTFSQTSAHISNTGPCFNTTSTLFQYCKRKKRSSDD